MSSIILGNLTVAEFASRVGAEFTEEERTELKKYRVQNASKIPTNGFHIFDAPVISIHIGKECLDKTKSIWSASNDRKTWNREVSFYPAEGWDV